MTELSPAAQAVLDGYNQDPFANTGEALADVLRAVADEVVPEESTKQKLFMWQRERLEQRLMTRKRILAIADNLEAH